MRSGQRKRYHNKSMGIYICNNNVTSQLIDCKINVSVFFDDKISVYFPIYCFIVCLFDGV